MNIRLMDVTVATVISVGNTSPLLLLLLLLLSERSATGTVQLVASASEERHEQEALTQASGHAPLGVSVLAIRMGASSHSSVVLAPQATARSCTCPTLMEDTTRLSSDTTLSIVDVLTEPDASSAATVAASTPASDMPDCVGLPTWRVSRPPPAASLQAESSASLLVSRREGWKDGRTEMEKQEQEQEQEARSERPKSCAAVWLASQAWHDAGCVSSAVWQNSSSPTEVYAV